MTRRRRGVATTIGGVLVGFDQQIFRSLPPVEELVHHARPDGPVATEDGGRITIRLPQPVDEADPEARPGEALDAESEAPSVGGAGDEDAADEDAADEDERR